MYVEYRITVFVHMCAIQPAIIIYNFDQDIMWISQHYMDQFCTYICCELHGFHNS